MMYVKSCLDAVGVLRGISLLSLISLSTQNIQVEIKGPTKPVPTGSNVTLECYARLEGNATLESMFFAKDGESTDLSDDTNHRIISIISVQMSDAGQYRCAAQSAGNKDMKLYTLSVFRDIANKDSVGKPGSDADGSSVPVYVYPIIAGIILLLLIAIAIFVRRRRRLREDPMDEEENGSAVIYKKTPVLQDETQPANPTEPIYENGPANQRPQNRHVAPTTTRPTKKLELTYSQLDFDNHVSGRPEKEWRAPGPRAADEYTEYAEITGTLNRGKTSN